jgi:hypothetical protein
MVAVSSSTRYFMVAGRILVQPDDPRDLEAVHELQERIRVRPWSRYAGGDASFPNGSRPQRLLGEDDQTVEPELRFLHQLGNVLEDVPPVAERALAASFGAIGLTPGRGFEPAALSAGVKAEVARGLERGAELVEQRSLNLGTNVNGWTTNYVGPRFGDDYLLRSAVAKDQIYVTVPEEALYPVAAVDAGGEPLDGAHAYRITFSPGGLPPVDAFWSVTMYDADYFFVANPINRYSISARQDLKTNPDGSSGLYIQKDSPGAAKESNWLPAPDGPIYLVMRLYWPKETPPSILPPGEGTWKPPGVKRVS